MRDPNRINPCCDQLANLWKQVPDWRLGQLLLNLFSQMSEAEIFYSEDYMLLSKLESTLAKWKEERK